MTMITAIDEEPTPASVWQAVSGGAIDDELLAWPPDLFALTDDESPVHRTVGRVIRSAIEQRQTRTQETDIPT